MMSLSSRMIRFLLISLIILSFFSFFVFALTFSEYEFLGERDYIRGDGIFNKNIVDDELTDSIIISNQAMIPLIDDLDNDGVNDIIIIDGSEIKIYYLDEDLDFKISDTYSSPFADDYQYMILNDIDEDGNNEIIVLDVDNHLAILNFNGSDISLVVNHTIDNGDIGVLNCDLGLCLLIMTDDDSSAFNTEADAWYYVFDETTIGTANNFHHRKADVNRYSLVCHPILPNIQIKDNDGNGTNNFIFSLLQVTSGIFDETAHIYYMTLSDDYTARIDYVLNHTIGYDETSIFSLGSCTSTQMHRYFTSPLVTNIKGTNPLGELETAIASSDNAEEFRIYTFKSNYATDGSFPTIAQADGTILSNIMKGNIFPDTDPNDEEWDLCVMGYSDVLNDMTLLCGSEHSGLFFDRAEEFDIVFDNYNISTTRGKYTSLAHLGQHLNDLTDGEDLNELICSYGVFKINYIGDNSLVEIYDSPRGEAVVIPIDYSNFGREDFLVLTETNLWYLDDGLSLKGAEIDYIWIDPCVRAVMKNRPNETDTIEIRIVVIDPDDNQVSAKIELYYGEAFEQDSGWRPNVSSGSTFTFLANINTSTSNSILRLSAVDTSNPDEIDIIDLSFVVSTDGFSRGDGCITEIDVSTSLEENLTADPTSLPNASLLFTGASNLDENLGLNIGNSNFYLLALFMIIAGVCFYGFKEKHSAVEVFGASAILFILGIGLGVSLGFLGVIWIFILVLFFIAIAVYGFRKMTIGG